VDLGHSRIADARQFLQLLIGQVVERGERAVVVSERRLIAVILTFDEPDAAAGNRNAFGDGAARAFFTGRAMTQALLIDVQRLGHRRRFWLFSFRAGKDRILPVAAAVRTILALPLPFDFRDISGLRAEVEHLGVFVADGLAGLAWKWRTAGNRVRARRACRDCASQTKSNDRSLLRRKWRGHCLLLL
jgi:hypothetical protein